MLTSVLLIGLLRPRPAVRVYEQNQQIIERISRLLREKTWPNHIDILMLFRKLLSSLKCHTGSCWYASCYKIAFCHATAVAYVSRVLCAIHDTSVNSGVLYSTYFGGPLRLAPFGIRKTILGVFTNKLVNFLVYFRGYILKIALSWSIFSPKCNK